MALPTSRQQFKSYCLRKLGSPVIEINVDDDQVEDRVDEALLYFADYHFDATDKVYFKYQLTVDDITNQYIPIPENIIGVVNIFDIGSAIGTSDLFNIRYQIALNDLYSFSSTQVTPYYMAMSNIQFLEQILVGRQPIRYNRHVNRLYIDCDWTQMNPGYFVVAECYQVIDPDTYTRTWSDRWLARYGTCLIKQQWGQNLSKFSGLKMPGGVMFNGDKIYNDAITEREALEKEMIYSYSLPVTDMIG